MKPIVRVAVLLLHFLAGMPMVAQAEPPRQPEATSVRVVLSRQHRLTANGVAATPETLVVILDRLTGKDHTRLVMLSAPPSARYGEVAAVMNRLEQSGYRQLMVVSPAPASR